MRFATKYIHIDRDITEVENDLQKLSGNTGLFDNSEHIEIFHGETNGRFFKFCYFDELRVREYIFEGELIDENKAGTLVKIDIILPSIVFWLNFGWLMFAICMIATKIIPSWSRYNLFINILSLIFLLCYPIGHIISYIYRLRIFTDDLSLYDRGYYDKYINK